ALPQGSRAGHREAPASSRYPRHITAARRTALSVRATSWMPLRTTAAAYRLSVVRVTSTVHGPVRPAAAVAEPGTSGVTDAVDADDLPVDFFFWPPWPWPACSMTLRYSSAAAFAAALRVLLISACCACSSLTRAFAA